MPLRFLLLAALAVPLLGGCVSQGRFARQGAVVDSLRASNRALTAQVYALEDSILFYDAVDSGQYFRDRRALLDSLDELNYLLDEARSPAPPPALATLAVDDLFAPASAELTEAGQAALAALGDTLQTVPGRIRVEAHSDSVPVGGSLVERYPSNWELSAARAAAVVRYLTGEAGLPPARFEVVSLADTQPTASNATAAGRSTNRRIRLVPLAR